MNTLLIRKCSASSELCITLVEPITPTGSLGNTIMAFNMFTHSLMSNFM